MTEAGTDLTAAFQEGRYFLRILIITLRAEVKRYDLWYIEFKVISYWISEVWIDPTLFKPLNRIRRLDIHGYYVIDHIIIIALFVYPSLEPSHHVLLR